MLNSETNTPINTIPNLSVVTVIKLLYETLDRYQSQSLWHKAAHKMFTNHACRDLFYNLVEMRDTKTYSKDKDPLQAIINKINANIGDLRDMLATAFLEELNPHLKNFKAQQDIRHFVVNQLETIRQSADWQESFGLPFTSHIPHHNLGNFQLIWHYFDVIFLLFAIFNCHLRKVPHKKNFQ